MMTDHDEAAALTAWRQAIAATDEARRRFRPERVFDVAGTLENIRVATLEEMNAGRRYLAARDASVAAQVTEAHEDG